MEQAEEETLVGNGRNGEIYCIMHGYHVVIAVACKGDDVTVAGWQVGQQVAHFRVATSFPASS